VVNAGAVDGSVATQQELPLLVPTSSATVNVNGRCMLRAEGEQRVVLVAGLAIHHYSVDDAVANAYAMVLLFDTGFATQKEIAFAFGCSERTVRRHQERYAEGGMTALAARSGWRTGRRRIAHRRRCDIERLNAEGLSNREIARRLGVNEKSIRKQVGPREPTTRQEVLALATSAGQCSMTVAASAGENRSENLEPGAVPAAPAPPLPNDLTNEEPEPIAMSLDLDPSNRIWDRLLACFGLLDDAQPVFGDAKAVPGAGIAVIRFMPHIRHRCRSNDGETIRSGAGRAIHQVHRGSPRWHPRVRPRWPTEWASRQTR